MLSVVSVRRVMAGIGFWSGQPAGFRAAGVGWLSFDVDAGNGTATPRKSAFVIQTDSSSRTTRKPVRPVHARDWSSLVMRGTGQPERLPSRGLK